MIQPPEIRHRVLFASEYIEVIEIGVPAEHVTTIDHDMNLPNGVVSPDRDFQGQRFVHHRADEAIWSRARLAGYQARDTTIAAHTGDVAGVQVIKRGTGTPDWAVHDADILFTFVMDGTMVLEGEGQDPFALEAGDAFVIPPGMATKYSEPSDDIELMEVSLPGRFQTRPTE